MLIKRKFRKKISLLISLLPCLINCRVAILEEGRAEITREINPKKPNKSHTNPNEDAHYGQPQPRMRSRKCHPA